MCANVIVLKMTTIVNKLSNEMSSIFIAIPDIYKLIFETHIDAIIIVDQHRNIVMVNPAFETVFGYEPQSVMGRNTQFLFADEQHYKQVGKRIRHVEYITPHKLERTTLVRKDGSQFIAEITGTSLTDEQGTFIGSFGIVRNIMPRQTALAEIRKRETLYRTIAQNLPRAGVIVFDNEMRYAVVEGAIVRIFGLDASSLEGKTLQEALPQAAIDFLLPYYESILSGKSQFLGGKTEDDLYWQAHGVPLHDEGNIIGGMLFIQDVTDLERSKREAVALSHTLEERVQERTAALQDSLENLDAFAHMVAHDLKSPVTSMISAADILQEDVLSKDEQDNFINIIRKKAHKMYAIVDDLLLLASTQNQDEIEVAPLDMNLIVTQAIHQVSRRHPHLKHNIEVPKTWHTALGYEPWIEAVWLNYLTNAVKYGGDPLQLKLGSEKLDNGHIRFWIEDNGIGVPPEYVEEIFKPLIRLHKDRAEGNGIGLSIVQRSITRLGGKVGVSPVSPTGSRFYFTLPSA